MNSRTLSQPRISLSLLSIPVAIECSEPEIAATLASCYRRSHASTEKTKGALQARLAAEGPDDSGQLRFRIEIDGREPSSACGAIEALRNFHHELLHAVMLRRNDLLYVHAAVVAIGGRAIVLPGLSQAGKSTLALALMLRGARLLSDELLALDPATLRALAYPRAIKIRDVCVPYFPSLAGRFFGEGEARYVPFEVLPEDAVAMEASVALIAMPRWSGDSGACLEPITRGRAVLDLATSTLNFGMHRTASVDYLGSLTESACACRILWRDPHEAAALLVRELDSSSQAS